MRHRNLRSLIIIVVLDEFLFFVRSSHFPTMSSASSSQPDKKRRVWSNQSVALASAIDSCVPQTEGTAPSALKRKRYSYCADLYNQVTSSAKHKGSLQSLDWGNDFGVLTSKDLPGAESDLFKQYKVSIFSLVASSSVSFAIIVFC
jgi:hypothetical protein